MSDLSAHTSFKEIDLARTEQFAAVSPASLIARLDPLFANYLDMVLARTIPGERRELVEWWQRAHEQRPLSAAVAEVFQLTAPSVRPYTPDELAHELGRFSRLGNEWCARHASECAERAQFLGTSPFSIALCRLFRQDERDLGWGQHIPARFFRHHLLQEVFFRPPELSAEDLFQRQRSHLLAGFNTLCKAALAGLAYFCKEPDRTLPLHNLLMAMKSPPEAEQLRIFQSRVTTLLENVTPANRFSFAASLQRILEEVVPETTQRSLDHLLVRLVTVGAPVTEAELINLRLGLDDEEEELPDRYFAVVPPDNFYFSPAEDEGVSEHDRAELPPAGRLNGTNGSSDLIEEDSVTIFAPDGTEVWRGHLHIEDIKTLVGPLYVVRNSEEYDSLYESGVPIPRGNRRLESRSGAGNTGREEAPTLDPDFVRLIAAGKIEDGRYRRNSRFAR